jgi:DNA-directed RNA polymerase omega subunit
MLYVPLEKLLDKTGNSVYSLVVLAAKRALEIAEGQPKLVEANSSVKPSAIALQEIAAGKVRFKQAGKAHSATS